MKKLLYILLHLVSFSAFAGNIKFTASVDKNVVALGEGLNLTFTINGSGTKFRAPELSENFKIYSGPNESRSMSLINGKVSSELSYSYVLIPINLGEYVIEPAEIEVDGKKYSSNPITIKVVKATPQSKKKEKAEKNWKRELAKNLYLKLELSKTKVYQGEQVLATYKLYNRANLAGIQGEKLPDFVGFYTQEIEINETNNRKREVINGVIYDVYTLKKTMLFPQKTGELILQPLTIDASVRFKEKTVNTWFGPQYQYNTKNVKIASKKRKIKVLPLPSTKPASYNGAIGKYSLNAELTKNALKSNEATYLKIKINGTGNINLVDISAPEFPSDFEVYDPKVNSQISKKNDVLSGTKSIEYLIIPRHSGDFVIPPIEFSYFNPTSKRFETLKSDPFKIHVDKSDDEGERSYVQTNKSQKGIQQIGSDIRYIKITQPEFIEEETTFFRSFWYYFFIVLPVLLFGVSLYFIRKYADMASDTVGMKKRKANKAASKHLSEAKKLLYSGNSTDFYDAISKALYGYLSDKLNLKQTDLSKENIVEILKHNNVSQEVISLFLETINNCEMARFAPSSDASTQVVYDSADKVITKLEEELK